MKKTFYVIAVAISAIAFVSCDKLIEWAFKSYEANIEFQTNIDPVLAGVTGTLGTSTVSYNLDAEVRKNTENKVGADFITQMYVKNITITATNANATNNLSNFETMSIVLNDGSGPVTIGPFSIPNSNLTTISLPVTDSPNIRRFFNGSNVSFAIIGKARTETNIRLNIDVSSTIRFDK